MADTDTDNDVISADISADIAGVEGARAKAFFRLAPTAHMPRTRVTDEFVDPVGLVASAYKTRDAPWHPKQGTPTVS